MRASSLQQAARTVIKVRDADGQVRLITFADVGITEAMRRAHARGLQVLSVEANTTPRSGRTVRWSLQLFSQELLALLNAGLNLTEALATLHAKEQQAGVEALLATILQAIREGRNFSDILAALPLHFPEVYIATVRAAERTGDLPQALARYIAYQGQFESIRKKLVTVAIYPAMLLLVGGFVTLFLLGYVVPRFSIVYESSGREMPWLSDLLLTFGKAIYANWRLALAGLSFVCLVLGWALSRAVGRAWLMNQFLRLPWLARRADQFRMARFYRSVSLLLASGIALPRAMGMVTGLLGPDDQARLQQCRLAVEQGQMLSAAMVESGLATPVAESLIKIGERSGELGEMLGRTASFSDDELARWIEWASRLLEPVLMIAIGLVIGTIVVLMYMPIFELAGSF